MASVNGFICFCPDLRLYHHKTFGEDGTVDSDYKFNADDLEDTVVALLAQEEDPRKQAEARWLVNMTGLARLNPHKIVKFDTGTDKIDILEPEPFWKEHDDARDAAVAAEDEAASGRKR